MSSKMNHFTLSSEFKLSTFEKTSGDGKIGMDLTGSAAFGILLPVLKLNSAGLEIGIGCFKNKKSPAKSRAPSIKLSKIIILVVFKIS